MSNDGLNDAKHPLMVSEETIRDLFRLERTRRRIAALRKAGLSQAEIDRALTMPHADDGSKR